jgi:predicted ABC-type ATPase
MTLPAGAEGSEIDRRPAIVCVSGPNGAGKTTFFYAHLRVAGLRFVNADLLAAELRIQPYAAARVAAGIRDELFRQRESFVFETVFSDPVGEKLDFLRKAARAGYTTILCFIGTAGPEVSEQRVAMRVSQGGHDVPPQKIVERYPRILANLKAALCELPNVWVFDNNDLRTPYRLVAVVQSGRVVRLHRPVPRWLAPLLPKS